jgi:hypothetical protein
MQTRVYNVITVILAFANQPKGLMVNSIVVILSEHRHLTIPATPDPLIRNTPLHRAHPISSVS